MFERIDKQGISDWFDKGVKEGYRYLVIYNDSWDYDYFPILYRNDTDLWEAIDKLNPRLTYVSMEEIYDLALDKEFQLSEQRANHRPPRPDKKKARRT